MPHRAIAATLREIELSPSLLLFSLGGDGLETGFGANCVVSAGRDATVVVDPLVAPAHARWVDEAIRRRALPPVRWVIATHHHTDHVLGAPVFLAQGARLVAHRAAAERIAAEHPGLIARRRAVPALRSLFEEARVCTPDVTLDATSVIDLGGREVVVLPLGHAHSPGDCAVLFPEEGAVCCGDVVVDGYHFNYEDADVSRIPETLRALADLATQGYSRFIPGHGAAGDVRRVEAQLRHHGELAELLAKGASAAAVGEAIRTRWPGWRLEAAIATAVARRWP